MAQPGVAEKVSVPDRSNPRGIAGIVLAAGGASRFGSAKQLLPWNKDTLVAHVARTSLEGGLNPVVVVTGYEAERVTNAVSNLLVSTVYNPEWETGQGSSLCRGVLAIERQSEAAIFLLVDQPAITPAILQTLAQSHRQTRALIVIPTYRNRRGNPVLFGRALFKELKSIRGDTGGRALFQKYQSKIAFVPVDNPGILQDIDTPEDYRIAAGYLPKARDGEHSG